MENEEGVILCMPRVHHPREEVRSNYSEIIVMYLYKPIVVITAFTPIIMDNIEEKI